MNRPTIFAQPRASNSQVRLACASALPLLVTALGCDDFTCADYATCEVPDAATSTFALTPDAAAPSIETANTARTSNTGTHNATTTSPGQLSITGKATDETATLEQSADAGSQTAEPTSPSTSQGTAATSPSDRPDASDDDQPSVYVPQTDAGFGIDASVTTDDPDAKPPSKLSNGDACESGDECSSNQCVDGVCCDSACDGVCAACNLEDAEGTCLATAHDESCGTPTCRPDTECLKYEAVNPEANCAGLNACLESAVCNELPVDVNTACQNGAGTCDGEGECIIPDKKILGETCDDNSECGSAHCATTVDGANVCCDATCNGVCQACSPSGRCDATPTDDIECGVVNCPSDTTCAAYPDDLTSNRCSSFGQCITTESSCAPTFIASGTSCGTGEICDGAGTCEACPSGGGASRVCTTECPCSSGEGVCDENNQCASGLICVSGGGRKYRFDGDTCLPAHCDNNIQDDNEQSVDCGGQCGCGATLYTSTLVANLKGISDDGSTIVMYTNGQNGGSAYVWKTGTNPLLISGVHRALGISGDGRMIVGSSNSGPVRWVNGGEPELLSPSEFGTGSAYGASSNGSTIVGSAQSLDEGELVGFLWSSAGPNSPAGFGGLRDVTADGSVSIGFDTNNVYKLWFRDSGSQTIALPGGWSFTAGALADMSSNGKYIAGNGSNTASTFASLLWDRVSNSVSILQPHPEISGSPFANAVADNGLVVGEACRNCDGMYWSPTDGFQPHEFLTLMASLGVEFPQGVTLGAVRVVTPDGKSFAGEAFGGDFFLWRLKID